MFESQTFIFYNYLHRKGGWKGRVASGKGTVERRHCEFARRCTAGNECIALTRLLEEVKVHNGE